MAEVRHGLFRNDIAQHGKGGGLRLGRNGLEEKDMEHKCAYILSQGPLRAVVATLCIAG